MAETQKEKGLFFPLNTSLNDLEAKMGRKMT